MAHDGQNETPAKITPLKNGPVKVEGALQICGPDGAVLEAKDVVFLCRCGASKNKPYCDGSHKPMGFEA
ncbi:MAG: CDGSH iron-sulfur domain-containing protein [Alphaproteobacteria bacterium]|jgi:CDGSH-type Zn-finger protein|nr:CDGSH iron-sulfur domain-containing protein [Alphaproteobacteria bacterium]